MPDPIQKDIRFVMNYATFSYSKEIMTDNWLEGTLIKLVKYWALGQTIGKIIVPIGFTMKATYVHKWWVISLETSGS